MRRHQKQNEVRVTIQVSEAALLAGSGERSIRDLIKAGIIPHLKFGRNIKIPRAAFLRWLDSCGAAAQQK
jgi:excisionase family DNA binding protein